jgi:hypothetical protein
MASTHCNKFLVILAAFGTILLSLTDAKAQRYTGSPVTKVRLVKTIQSKQFAVPIIIKQIQLSGVDFELTPAVEGELLAVNANQQIINAVRDNYRYRGQAGGRTGNQKPPVTPERDITGENYERLFYQGLETLNSVRTATNVAQVKSASQSAIDIGNQAIRLIPTRPEAYTLVGGSYLIVRDFSDAERYGQMAVDRGGSLAFPVFHLTANPHPEVLYIGKGFVTIESNQEFFQFNGREVSNPRPENDYFYNGIRVAVFSFQTYKNGRLDTWYFTPGNTYTPQEAAIILDLIKRNSI